MSRKKSIKKPCEFEFKGLKTNNPSRDEKRIDNHIKHEHRKENILLVVLCIILLAITTGVMIKSIPIPKGVVGGIFSIAGFYLKRFL